MNRLYYGPWVSKRADWEVVDRAFAKTNARILELVKKIPHDQLETKVLVPPMPGLEDSSRFWSVAMTLEHIEFVGRNVAMTIIALSKGNQPPLRVNIANLKPKGLSKPEAQIELFEKYAAEIPRLLASEVQNRKSRTTLPHPWFGRFNAGQWHWLLAAHSRIHFPQLLAITQGLSPKRAAHL